MNLLENVTNCVRPASVAETELGVAMEQSEEISSEFGDAVEKVEIASVKDEVTQLSTRLARVEGSIMSVIDSKMQIVQQTLEATVEALMMRVMQQLEAKLNEMVQKISAPVASQTKSG